jgi:hypothetical protein
MFLMIVTAVVAIAWALLPEVTAALEFCIALINLILAVHLLLCRLRRWLSRRRRVMHRDGS